MYYVYPTGVFENTCDLAAPPMMPVSRKVENNTALWIVLFIDSEDIDSYCTSADLFCTCRHSPSQFYSHQAPPRPSSPPQKLLRSPTELVAPDLIGCLLAKRQEYGSLLWGVVVETEAYSQEEPAYSKESLVVPCFFFGHLVVVATCMNDWELASFWKGFRLESR